MPLHGPHMLPAAQEPCNFMVLPEGGTWNAANEHGEVEDSGSPSLDGTWLQALTEFNLYGVLITNNALAAPATIDILHGDITTLLYRITVDVPAEIPSGSYIPIATGIGAKSTTYAPRTRTGGGFHVIVPTDLDAILFYRRVRNG